MCAELFTARDMPEAPKEGFFKSLLGGGQRNLDREELCNFIKIIELPYNQKRYRGSHTDIDFIINDLFVLFFPVLCLFYGYNMFMGDLRYIVGETSGKPNRSVAKHIPGTALENLNQRSNTAASAIAQAHQLALERGDKLNQLVERTERMSNESHQFSSAAHTLMNKYKDKKWYQI